ncbi:MAG: alpha-isopropylmalate synthase regulatory domain-containing protein, partial [Ilumatobacteraceae bacterium]
PTKPKYQLSSHEFRSDSTGNRTLITAQVDVDGKRHTIIGEGNGPMNAFVMALRNGFNSPLDVKDYSQHSIGQGSEASAVAYVETADSEGNIFWGVGVDPNTITASLRALLNAHERHGQ